MYKRKSIVSKSNGKGEEGVRGGLCTRTVGVRSGTINSNLVFRLVIRDVGIDFLN